MSTDMKISSSCFKLMKKQSRYFFETHGSSLTFL